MVRCQNCGKDTAQIRYVQVGGTVLTVCPDCFKEYERGMFGAGAGQVIELLYPELNARHSPLSTMIVRGLGFRESLLPLGISLKKKEGEPEKAEEEGAPIRKEEIDWDVLVGSEPIDELKGRSLAHVLAAKFAEDNGVVTSKELARYLFEMAQNPELEPYLERFKNINEDAAREILNDLATMNIVKKEARKGAKGANIYDYLAAERSWRKEGF